MATIPCGACKKEIARLEARERARAKQTITISAQAEKLGKRKERIWQLEVDVRLLQRENDELRNALAAKEIDPDLVLRTARQADRRRTTKFGVRIKRRAMTT